MDGCKPRLPNKCAEDSSSGANANRFLISSSIESLSRRDGYRMDTELHNWLDRFQGFSFVWMYSLHFDQMCCARILV